MLLSVDILEPQSQVDRRQPSLLYPHKTTQADIKRHRLRADVRQVLCCLKLI